MTFKSRKIELEKMRIDDIHNLYRCMFDHKAKVTSVEEIHPNVFHISLGWWKYEIIAGSNEIISKFWSSRIIILEPQVCKIIKCQLLKLSQKV
jgi:hypothetical protein